MNDVQNVALLLNQKRSLIDYLRTKIDSEDWHAVQDAASDIREIEAKLRVYKSLRIGEVK